ncbi:MAG: VWA domain-containing protein, partial [Bacteroidia bacterium]|nr:VWA domain-containing protein [Bacteroidia bacterium]
ILNENFSAFLVNDIDFQSFPPLVSSFDPIIFNTKIETLLYKSVNGINTEQPLLAIVEVNNKREALLLGEGLWRWRAHSFLSKNSFNDFDTFISKLVLYLSSNDMKKRLIIDNESFYYANDDIIISVQYFNKNYELDPNANLELELTNKNTGVSRALPFNFNKNKYQVKLSEISAADYSVKVNVQDTNMSVESSFKVIEHVVEHQFLNANSSKLKIISSYSNGKSYFIDEVNTIFSDLLEDNRYQTIQKSNKNTVPLIDFKILLLVIVLSLAIEWFLRKYNGLI